MPHATRLTRRLSLLGAAIATGVLALAAASPAVAHDTLVASDPSDGATVETMPDELTLTFSAELIDAGDGTAVDVASPSGADATAGDPVLSGEVVTVPLADAPEAGDYTVTWRVVSSDGHPIDGTFSFTVSDPTPASPSPEPTQTPDEPDTATESPAASPSASPTADPADGTPADGDSFMRNLPWIVGGLVLVALLGALVAVLVARTRRGGSEGDDPGRTPPAER